jgi:hypothetical protein
MSDPEPDPAIPRGQIRCLSDVVSESAKVFLDPELRKTPQTDYHLYRLKNVVNNQYCKKIMKKSNLFLFLENR